MLYWLDKGFTLNGVQGQPDVFVISKPGKHAVVRKNWFDEYVKETEWFATPEQAQAAARELQFA